MAAVITWAASAPAAISSAIASLTVKPALAPSAIAFATAAFF